MITPVFAHFGHWYFQLLYAVPIAAIVAWLSLQSWREGRQRRRDQHGDERRRDRRRDS
jgi:hypothetical protein